MAPHLTAAELDYIFQLDRAGRRPAEIHASLVSKRARRGIAAPTLARFRAALRGTTYKRSRKETRGRKQKLSRHAVLKMNQTRKQLIKKGARTARGSLGGHPHGCACTSSASDDPEEVLRA